MLIELDKLYKSLDQHGVVLHKSHKHICKPAKGKYIRVYLDASGLISGINETIIDERSCDDFWEYREASSTASFPIFRLDDIGFDQSADIILPRHMPLKNGKNSFAQLISKIRSLIDLSKVPCLDALVSRFEKSMMDPEYFCMDLFSRVRSLGFKYDKKSKPKIPVILDLSDFDKFNSTIFSMTVKNSVILDLVSKSGSSKKGNCCIKGSKEDLWDGNFPKPNLPIVGITGLFSANKDNPSLKRYECASVGRCPVASSVVVNALDAISFMAKEKNKNKTWVGFYKELVIAYLESKPFSDVSLLGLLLPKCSEASCFLSAVETFVERLGSFGISKGSNNDNIRILSICSVDEGNSIASLDVMVSVDDLIDMSGLWSNGLRNYPGSDNASNDLYPLAFCGEADVSYRRSEKPEYNNRFSVSDSYRLFRYHDTLLANRVLDKALRGISTISLVDLCSANYASKIIKVMSILLYILGRKKEYYVNSYAYLLGRWLRLLDVIHIDYHKYIRDTITPRSTIGSNLCSIVQSNPEKGLDHIRRKALFLINWVRCGAQHSGGKAWNALKANKEIEDIATSLGSMESIPSRMSLSDRAEFTIGYMTRANLPNYNKKDGENSE